MPCLSKQLELLQMQEFFLSSLPGIKHASALMQG
jgi:hypothetical protein